MTLLRQSALSAKSCQMCREDVYELAYCYDSRASNQDLFRRSVEPFAYKLLEGCNVNVIVLGSTQSGKELLLEGLDTEAGVSGESAGIISQFVDLLFQQLHSSSIKVCLVPSLEREFPVL